ncbi:serine/threonine-protein kinase VRK1-like isoform X2 [Dysidea avara]|uniref:serine/threonine-protein kinase VRK1-like isoform X2 n=1 Tax=Dysidea avara TaxID=196820 RepID=UPI0033314CE4
MPPKRGPKAYKLAKPLPPGEIMTDMLKKQWVLGAPVGQGGFGLIYLAAPESEKHADDKNADYVIKLEPHENGPLFTELAFYHRVAKKEKMDEWRKTHTVSYLGIPVYIGSGSHTNSGVQYRFMVMQRFGTDLEKIFNDCGRCFGLPTVCFLALRVLESLEYLHSQGYVHADVKASNLLTGHKNKHEVYLVDYGLATHYTLGGKHRAYKEDPRKAHDGTIEFTSRDAHKGVAPSRRSDLEILGYCLLQWASGRLPWEGNLSNKPAVASQKEKYMKEPSSLMKACFSTGPSPKCLSAYLDNVSALDYDETPNYSNLKRLFVKELSSLGCDDRPDVLDWISTKPKAAKKRSIVDDTDIDKQPARKRKTPSPAVSPARPAVGSSSSSPPTRLVKKTARPVKKKKVLSSIADDIDSNEQPVPSSPPKPVVKTSKPAKKKAATSPDSQLLRRSPRQQKPNAREILAAKMKIGASIIPGAVTVVPRTKAKPKSKNEMV